MRTAIILAGALLVGWTTAQDPVDPKPQAPATAAERMQELQDLQQKCIADWRQAVKKAQDAAKDATPDQIVPAMPMRPDFGPIVGKAKAYAAEFKGTDDAVSFLLFVVQNGGQDKASVREAFDTLLASHLDSDELGGMGSMFQYLDRIVDEQYAETAMAKLVNSGNAKVRGWALLAKHKEDIEEADRESQDYDIAKKTLLKAAEAADDERLASEIRSAIDLREKLGVGNVAPDIAGVDLDGVEFKLSDYKGKVIFLDFWGDW